MKRLKKSNPADIYEHLADYYHRIKATIHNPTDRLNRRLQYCLRRLKPNLHELQPAPPRFVRQ